ncbi:unnamed protein product [Camellia sinensis]
MSSDPVKTTSQPVLRRKGGLRTMPFVIANEALEKVASVGLHANMILYLKNEYHLSIVTGTSILFLWNAVSNFLPTFGAFLSDSYLGRFRVAGLGSIVTLLGLVVLWFTAIFKHKRPPQCDHPNTDHCTSPKPAQLALLFSSFVLMAIGAGGIRPCSLAFGADQFNKPDNPKNTRVLQTFFNWSSIRRYGRKLSHCGSEWMIPEIGPRPNIYSEEQEHEHPLRARGVSPMAVPESAMNANADGHANTKTNMMDLNCSHIRYMSRLQIIRSMHLNITVGLYFPDSQIFN